MRRQLFRFYAGRDFMRPSGFVARLAILPRPDITSEGHEVLSWWTAEVRIPWPLFTFRARSDAAEIRFRDSVLKMIEDDA